MNNAPPKVVIHRVHDVVAHADGETILLRAEAGHETRLTALEIAVTTEPAPAIALAMLATTAKALAHQDELELALNVLGLAVVRSGAEETVRLQLLFDKGAVLPVEMTLKAARAFCAGLVEYLDSSRRRPAKRIAGTDSWRFVQRHCRLPPG